ncbi:MAG TPA: hypothetical protein VGF69_01610 [Thermoanaerobaculia bacterium]|jgi:hypothetical protein
MTISSNSNTAVIIPDNVATLTPEQFTEQVRALRQHVPGFAPLAVPQSVGLHRSANVDDSLVQAGISAVAASSAISSALGRTGDDLTQERAEVIRWRVAEDELRTLLEGVSAANLIRRHRLGVTVLQAYSISRQLVRTENFADLLPHVDTMRRLNKLGRRKRVEVAPPAPKPVATTTTES